MKRFKQVLTYRNAPQLIVVLLLAFVAHSQAFATTPVSKPIDIDIASVINAVKIELRAAEEVHLGEPRLVLSEVKLDIKSVVVKSADGTVKLNIPIWGANLKGGVSGTATRTQDVSLTLAPPEQVMLQGSTLTDDMNIAQAIVSIRRQLQQGLKTQPILLPKELQFEIDFAVKRDITGSGGIKLVFVEAGPSGKYSTETTQKLSLKFVPPKGPQ